MQADFIHVTLILPTGQVQADRLQELGQQIMIGFDRPMVAADLQGKESKFPWTETSKTSLTDASGAPKLVHSFKLARYCFEHRICWLDSDYPGCPQCSELEGP
jgi:hypothetical protein